MKKLFSRWLIWRALDEGGSPDRIASGDSDLLRYAERMRELEEQLVRESEGARTSPPSDLHARTLRAIESTVHSGGGVSRSSPWRLRLSVGVAVIVILVAALVALNQFRPESPANQIVQDSPEERGETPTDGPRITRQHIESLIRQSSESMYALVDAPFRKELEAMAADTRRVRDYLTERVLFHINIPLPGIDDGEPGQ